jgi:hypothetical protein
MKYLIMIYSNPENWEHPIFAQDPRFRALPQEERDAVLHESDGPRFQGYGNPPTRTGELGLACG